MALEYPEPVASSGLFEPILSKHSVISKHDRLARPERASFPVNLSRTHPEPQSPYMSPEFDLLLKCGIPHDELLLACELAFVQGVPLDEYMLAEGLVSEVLLYYTLSQVLKRPFVEYEVTLANISAPRAQLITGVILVREGGAAFRYLVAPRGRALRALLQDRNNRRAELAVTTPSHLTKLISAQAQRAIVHEASMGLWTKAKHLSAREPPARAQYIFLGGFMFILSFLGALDWRAALDMISLAFSLIFFLFVMVRLIAIWVSEDYHPSQNPYTDLPDFMLPRYTIVAALYKEARVAEKLAKALASLDYPALGSKHTKRSMA